MPNKKGNPNGAGRKKGSRNIMRLEDKEFIREIMLKNRHRLEEELSKLDGKEFVTAYMSIVPYVLCKAEAAPPTAADKSDAAWSSVFMKKISAPAPAPEQNSDSKPVAAAM